MQKPKALSEQSQFPQSSYRSSPQSIRHPCWLLTVVMPRRIIAEERRKSINGFPEKSKTNMCHWKLIETRRIYWPQRRELFLFGLFLNGLFLSPKIKRSLNCDAKLASWPNGKLFALISHLSNYWSSINSVIPVDSELWFTCVWFICYLSKSSLIKATVIEPVII